MTSTRKQGWDRRVEAFFDGREEELFWRKDHYRELWKAHRDAELASSHFVSELTSGRESRFRQRVWEMALGQHLIECGHHVTSRPDGEPDFRIEVGGRVIWIEAVSPEPVGLPVDWTTWKVDQPNSAGLVPFAGMLLRYTTALNAKHNKGLKYRETGIVRPEDAYVVAIDQSQINRLPDLNGLSRKPFVAEAVFALGPWALEIDTASRKVGRSFQTVAQVIRNKNNAAVPTDLFYRPEYSGMTAVLGCHPLGSAGRLLPLKVAHNPLADAPIGLGTLGNLAEEWQATLLKQDVDGNQDWELRRA